MKKAFIVLLLIVIAVLVFLLVRSRRNVGMTIINQPYKGKTIKVQQCPPPLGKDKKVCIIPVEYLLQMTQPGSGEPDTAIEVHRKDTIVWVSWNGASITAVNPMDPIDCVTHQKIKIQDGGPFIDQPSGNGSAKYAHVNDDDHNDYNCFKTNITVNVSGVVTTIDPHLFDGGP